MYGLATCTVTILRPTVVPDALGDKRSQYIRIATGLPAAIQEVGSTVQSYATQTPRAVRGISGSFPCGTDLQVLDRVSDDTHGVVYEVTNVTQNRAPGHAPDLLANLKKVTS